MKIAVLISGGVDSSVVLAKLVEEGHDVDAYYLKIWLEDELSFLNECPWEDDLKYVRSICEKYGVKLNIAPFQKDYHEKVVGYTIESVKKGLTPNPDMMCNSLIKFGLFLDKYGDQYDKVASGHYSQVEQNEEGFYYLIKAPDQIKDQTYFLARLSQKQLSKVMFPIGDLTKEEVRELAKKYNLPNKNRKDSQGICFLGKFKYRDFIKNYLGEMPGDLVEFESGEVIGQHRGFYYYTVGQRKGIELSGGPWYVVKKDCPKNIVYISNQYHELDESRDVVNVTDFNWFSGKAPKKDDLTVKLRHGEQTHNCKIIERSETKLKIKLDEDDQGIAAGQYAVFFDGENCLGSGVIC
jgi:tRNA-specific 2-thiouridylase